MSDDPTPVPTPDPDPTPEPERTLNQAQVDRIVQDRVARERAKYEGFEDFKAKAEKFDEHTAASQTELERERTRAEAAEKLWEAAKETVKEERLLREIGGEAARLGFTDPTDAIALIRPKIKFDDDGNPLNVSEETAALREGKPYLAGQTTQGSADQGARGNDGAKQITQDELSKLTDAEYEQAKKDGRLKDFGIGL